MPSCGKCGEIVDKTDDSTCKAILKFCVMHNISPRELIDIDSGRHNDIASAYTNLPDKAKKSIKSLTETMKKGQSKTTIAKNPAKKPAGKTKRPKK